MNPWKRWDHDPNPEAAWNTTKLKGRKELSWVCPDCGHRFTAPVFEMTVNPTCPRCAQTRHEAHDALRAVYEKTPIADVPQLLSDWDDPQDPRFVMVADHTMRKFCCVKGHRPRIAPWTYLSGGCQFCRRDANPPEQRFVADTLPEIATQWHSGRNGALTADTVVWNSTRQIWWHASCCNLDWQAAPVDRDKYDRLRCPSCRSVLGSLAWEYPKIAAEWANDNQVDAWHVRPVANTPWIPKWVCANNPSHTWGMSLASRASGGSCPECREAGKSKVELLYCAAAIREFGSAKSGQLLRDSSFRERTSWSADITTSWQGVPVVIEYDGSYWHAERDKQDVDIRKTNDLLAADYRVVRLREHPLEPLELASEYLLQLTVYGQAPTPDETMTQVLNWLRSR